MTSGIIDRHQRCLSDLKSSINSKGDDYRRPGLHVREH